nr:hypothetical protein [uncultured Desulfobacter sp.]
MEMILQAWGGGFYLVNKILFAMAEGRRGREAKSLKLFGWMVYITGVPAWVIILVMHHDWMAASIEAGGAAGHGLRVLQCMDGQKST